MDTGVYGLIASTSSVLKKYTIKDGIKQKWPDPILEIQKSLSTAYDSEGTIKVLKNFISKYG